MLLVTVLVSVALPSHVCSDYILLKKLIFIYIGKIPEDLKIIGRLWRYDPADKSLHEMENGIVCGNEIVWSPDNKTREFRLGDNFRVTLISNSVLQRLCSSAHVCL